MFQTSAWHFCHLTSSCIIPFHDSFFLFYDVFLMLHSYRSGFLESLKSDFPEAFSSTAWIASRHPWWSFRLSPTAKRMERVWRGGLIRNNFNSSGDPFFFSKHESCFHGKKGQATVGFPFLARSAPMFEVKDHPVTLGNSAVRCWAPSDVFE